MTYDFCASAPGKLFLGGEYAVLEGSRAVITSVDKRVTATTTRQNIPQSGLLKDVKSGVEAFLVARAGKAVGQLPNVDIDSRGFSRHRNKLGIGSSAAVAAATTGALFAWAGVDIKGNQSDLLQVATDSHRAYQQGKGSGADVATSVLGNTVVFQRDGAPKVVEKPNLERVFVWTGTSASTVSLVEEVSNWNRRNPEAYAQVMGRLVALAEELADCYLEGNAARIIPLVAKYGDTMEALGNAASAPIITPELQFVANAARECGGAAKPSGAGGGDMAVGIFPSAKEADNFRQQCQTKNLDVMDFETHVDGVRLEK